MEDRLFFLITFVIEVWLKGKYFDSFYSVVFVYTYLFIQYFDTLQESFLSFRLSLRTFWKFWKSKLGFRNFLLKWIKYFFSYLTFFTDLLFEDGFIPVQRVPTMNRVLLHLPVNIHLLIIPLDVTRAMAAQSSLVFFLRFLNINRRLIQLKTTN